MLNRQYKKKIPDVAMMVCCCVLLHCLANDRALIDEHNKPVPIDLGRRPRETGNDPLFIIIIIIIPERYYYI